MFWCHGRCWNEGHLLLFMGGIMLKISSLLFFSLVLSTVSADFPPPKTQLDESVNQINSDDQSSSDCKDIYLENEPNLILEPQKKLNVDVEITGYGRIPDFVKVIHVLDIESAQFSVINEGTVEFLISIGFFGCCNGIISTEKPEFIEVLRKVTPEDEEKLTSAVLNNIKDFIKNESDNFSSDNISQEVFEKYEQAIAKELESILSQMVRELEGAKALVKNNKDFVSFILPVIDQEFLNVDSSKTSKEAIWEICINISNAAMRFAKNVDIESSYIFDDPIRRVPMEIRFAILNCMNHEQQEFAAETANIDDLVILKQKMQEFFQKIPSIVFSRLQDFYPALDKSILS